MKHLYQILFILTLYCCTNDNKSKQTNIQNNRIGKQSTIYVKKQKFIFQAKYYNPHKKMIDEDTIILTTYNKKWAYDSLQFLIEWTKRKLPLYSISGGTGVIDKSNEVWMHPPREGNCAILELCPFPNVKYPLIEGKKWSWELEIGDQYSNKEWAKWKGVITNYSSYEIKRFKHKQTIFGILECCEINATSKSKIGTSSLKTLFNEKYGFIYLDFECINRSRIEMNLINVLEMPDDKSNLNFFETK